jgi:hypothetical protein
MTPKDVIEGLSPTARRVFYAVFGLLGLALTATQVGFSAADVAQPLWLVVAWPVYGTLGTGFGVLANQNVNAKPVAVLEIDTTPTDPDYKPDHRAE